MPKENCKHDGDWEIFGNTSYRCSTCKQCGADVNDLHVRIMELKRRIEKIEGLVNV